MSAADLNIAELNDLRIFADNEISAGRYIEGQRLHDLIAGYGAAEDLEDADAKLEDLKDEKEAGCARAKAARDLLRATFTALKAQSTALDEATGETKTPIDIKTSKPKKAGKTASIDKLVAFVALQGVASEVQREIEQACTQLEAAIEKLDEAVTELL